MPQRRRARMPPTTCLSKANIRGRSNAPLIFYLLKSAPFLDIFGCARHSPNKFGSALACPKICFEIFGCARQYEQALLHSLARKFALRFSAALGNMSKLYFLTFSAALGNMSKLYCTRLHENCTRLHENWLRLGIIQVNLASFSPCTNVHIKCTFGGGSA